MADRTEEMMKRLGGPRPLPPELHARLEETFLGAGDVEARLAGAAVPRPVPPALRERIEETFASARPVPSSLRGRLERALVPARDRRRALGIAASVLLIAASTVAVLESMRGGSTRSPFAAPPAPLPTTVQGTPAPSTASPAAGTVPGAAVIIGEAAPGGTSAFTARASGAPPPFAFGPSSHDQQAPTAAATGRSEAGPGAEPTPASGALRIGIVRGDPAQEAGFRAYADLLNRAGGAGGHPFALIEISASAPATGTVATVNLSGGAIATSAGPPSWAPGPLLETLAVPEDILRGDVYDFASAPERQAHLAADLAFPDAARNARAAIYHSRTGIFAELVPSALEEVLRARGVIPVRVLYEPAAPAPLVGADAAFLSLPTDAARQWLSLANGQGYAPPRGVFGVYSLFDDELARDLAPRGRALSPYRPPTGEEATALRAGSGRAPGAAVLHGWVTAKSLAVAIWGNRTDTATEVRRALDALAGYNNGFMPPYELHPGTHSRTPEALALRPSGGAFVADTGFRRDAFPR